MKPSKSIAVLVLCSFMWACWSQQNIAALVSIMTNAASSIASAGNNPTLAQKIKTDGDAAAAAVLNWQNGSPVQEAEQALNILLDDLSLIPGTSQYAPLVAICVSAAEAILALLPQPTQSAKTKARLGASQKAALKSAPKNAKDFKKQWNAIRAQHPEWTAIPTL